MSRCKACDSLLSDIDLRRVTKNNQPEEYCVACRTASDNPDSLDWKWQQFGDIYSDSALEAFINLNEQGE